MDVRSVVGEGSEFVVTLPAEVPGIDTTGHAAGDALALPHASVHRDRRALVVDDDDNARETLGAMLSALGIDADLCTGQEGVARFGTGHYDIVVIDLELPDVSGFEVARRIRTVAVPDDDGRHPAILGVSAYDRRRCARTSRYSTHSCRSPSTCANSARSSRSCSPEPVRRRCAARCRSLPLVALVAAYSPIRCSTISRRCARRCSNR